MNEHDAVEAAFNNGYAKGYADGKAKVMSKIAFPRFLVRQPELSKKDVEDILMQSPTIIMDKTEIIPIYPYRWIPVAERLPEEHDSIWAYLYGTKSWQPGLFRKCSYDVIACVEREDGSKRVIAIRMIDGKWDWHKLQDGEQVTHWMPLPPAPEENK